MAVVAEPMARQLVPWTQEQSIAKLKALAFQAIEDSSRVLSYMLEPTRESDWFSAKQWQDIRTDEEVKARTATTKHFLLWPSNASGKNKKASSQAMKLNRVSCKHRQQCETHVTSAHFGPACGFMYAQIAQSWIAPNY